MNPTEMGAFLSMARELWVLKDRQRMLEALLTNRGILESGAVTEVQPDAVLQAELERECRQYIERLLAELRSSGSN